MAEKELFSDGKSARTVNLVFRIDYYTAWGQSLIVCGSEPLLGSWNVMKGLNLSPLHVGKEIMWRGSIKVPPKFECEYSYYVVDDLRNILRGEAGGKRKLLLSETVSKGEQVELRNLWKVCSSSCCRVGIWSIRQHLESLGTAAALCFDLDSIWGRQDCPDSNSDPPPSLPINWEWFSLSSPPLVANWT